MIMMMMIHTRWFKYDRDTAALFKYKSVPVIFEPPCIFKSNQRDATLRNLFISVKCSTCFRRLLRPSSGAQNCTYSIGYFVKTLLLPSTVMEEMRSISSTRVAGSSKVLTKFPILYIKFWAPDDGRRNRLKHVEHFTEINKFWNVASCWLRFKIRLRCTDPWTSKMIQLCKGAGKQNGYYISSNKFYSIFQAQFGTELMKIIIFSWNPHWHRWNQTVPLNIFGKTALPHELSTICISQGN